MLSRKRLPTASTTYQRVAQCDRRRGTSYLLVALCTPGGGGNAFVYKIQSITRWKQIKLAGRHAIRNAALAAILIRVVRQECRANIGHSVNYALELGSPSRDPELRAATCRSGVPAIGCSCWFAGGNMALRLVGSALVCAQLWTICLSAGPDTVAWNLMSVKHPDEVWHLERVEFLKRAPGGNEETVRWRSACHTGCDDSTRRAAGRINWNAKAVNVNRPPDRVFCLRSVYSCTVRRRSRRLLMCRHQGTNSTRQRRTAWCRSTQSALSRSTGGRWRPDMSEYLSRLRP